MRKTFTISIFLMLSFSLIAQTWNPVGNDILGEDTEDFFGTSVSLSADGLVMAIWAPNNDGNGTDAGHVRVYRNESGTWAQIGQDIDGEASGDGSPYAVSSGVEKTVSLSEDGSVVAIGAQYNDENGADAGHVRIYQNISGTWTQVGDDIDGEAAEDYSGQSVSLSGDGTIVAVGAPGSDGNGENAGHVRIYRNETGIWTQIGQDIDGEAAGDQSGCSVSLSSDGSVVAIGAIKNDSTGINGFVQDAGHVRVYQNINGSWTKIGQDMNGIAALDHFGISVSLSSDGLVVACGASNESNSLGGDLGGYVRICQNIGGTWTQIGQDIVGVERMANFGLSVSLSADGSAVAIGAPINDGSEIASGQAFVYQNTNGTWTQVGQDINGDAMLDLFGESVSLSADGTVVAIGAIQDNDSEVDPGYVRILTTRSRLKFVDYDGGLLKEEMVAYDSAATAPANPTRPGYTFSGWDIDFSNITSDTTVTAEYSVATDINSTTTSSVKVYPNPAKTRITIANAQGKNVTIFSLSGTKVMQVEMKQLNETIDIDMLRTGIYFIEIDSQITKLVVE